MVSPDSNISLARPETVSSDEEAAYDSAESLSSEEIMEPNEDDETSSSGSSEDEEDSDEEDTDRNEITISNVSSRPASTARSPMDLKSRLASFIPQLKQANFELETDPEVATKQIDRVDDEEEQYIEMDLGLGVLKERRRAEETGIKTSAPEDSDSSESSSDENLSVSEHQIEQGVPPVGVVDKMKGVKPAKKKIQEVD